MKQGGASAGGGNGAGFLARWLFSPLVGVTLGDWLRLVGRHGFDISPRYWPRAWFTSMMAAGNSMLAGREARRHRAALDEIEVEAPVFVIGHHRSGTTHLWNLLSTNPAFAYPTILQAVFPHTFLTAESAMQGLAARFTPKQRPQDNVRMAPESPLEEERAICTMTFLSMQMARHFPRREERYRPYLTMREANPTERARWQDALDVFGKKLLLRHGADKTLLFKAPDHTGKIDLILERYPDARFVHIHRDPYAVFVSTRAMERRTRPLYYYQKPAKDPDALDDFILWRYRAMFDAFAAAAAKVPGGQLIDIAFEDLEADPVGEVGRVYEALSLPGWDTARLELETYARSIEGYRKNVYADLPEDLRGRIASEWAPAFEYWGYDA